MLGHTSSQSSTPSPSRCEHERAALSTVSPAAPSDLFGISVSVSGNTAVVGAPNDDCVVGSHCGAAYVFHFNGTSWIQEQKLSASDAAVDDLFGVSDSVSGDTGVAGAPEDDCAAGLDCGAAYVFALGPDCNRSGLTDACDIRDETSPDNNGDGVPDECQCVRPSAPEAETLAATPPYSPPWKGGRARTLRSLPSM